MDIINKIFNLIKIKLSYITVKLLYDDMDFNTGWEHYNIYNLPPGSLSIEYKLSDDGAIVNDNDKYGEYGIDIKLLTENKRDVKSMYSFWIRDNKISECKFTSSYDKYRRNAFKKYRLSSKTKSLLIREVKIIIQRQLTSNLENNETIDIDYLSKLKRIDLFGEFETEIINNLIGDIKDKPNNNNNNNNNNSLLGLTPLGNVYGTSSMYQTTSQSSINLSTGELGGSYGKYLPGNNSPARIPAGGGSLLEYKGDLSGDILPITKSQTEQLYNDFVTLFIDALGSSLADYKFTNEYKTYSGNGDDVYLSIRVLLMINKTDALFVDRSGNKIHLLEVLINSNITTIKVHTEYNISRLFDVEYGMNHIRNAQNFIGYNPDDIRNEILFNLRPM